MATAQELTVTSSLTVGGAVALSSALTIGASAVFSGTVTASTNIVAPSTDGVRIQGTATNNSVSEGFVGEWVEGVRTSSHTQGMPSGVATDIASMSIGAGDWNVDGEVHFITAVSDNWTRLLVSISTQSGNPNTTPTAFGVLSCSGSTPGTAATNTVKAGTRRLTFTSSGTVYIMGTPTYTGGVNSMAGYGAITARRPR